MGRAAAIGREFYGKLLATGAVLYLLLATFPGNYSAITSGLDPSWVYALNVLPYSIYEFGRDVVFTWGPLGYLLNPLDIGSNQTQAIIFWLLVHALFAAILLAEAWRRGRWGHALVFVFGYLASAASGLYYDYALLTVTALLATLDSHGPRWVGPAAAAGAGILAAVGLFVKFSLGLASISLIGVLGILKLLRRPSSALRWALPAGAGAVGATVAIVAGVLDGFGNFRAWLRASNEVAAGYSSAMSDPVNAAIVSAGIASAVIFAAVAVATRWLDPTRLPLALSLAPPLFFAFKHGFVRHQGRIFLPVVMAMLAVLAVRATRLRGALAVLSALAVVFALGRWSAGYDTCRCAAPLSDVLAGRQGLAHLKALLGLPTTRRNLEARSRAALEPLRLPGAWLEQTARPGVRVDVVPWEITYVAANGLAWSPNPALGLYQAYTPFLDRWSADHYSGPNAPDYVLASFIDIDGRHPLMGAPRTWRALIRNYRLADAEPTSGLFLLKRDPRAKPELRAVGSTQGRVGDWITVPPSRRPLFAGLDLRLTPGGRALEFLWSIPWLEIKVLYADGQTGVYRLIAATAGGGILINPVPADREEFGRLIAGTLDTSVEQFAIGGPGARYYSPNIEITWLEAI